jgi:hypothetical protein
VNGPNLSERTSLWLITCACRCLPIDVRADRLREWSGELRSVGYELSTRRISRHVRVFIFAVGVAQAACVIAASFVTPVKLRNYALGFVGYGAYVIGFNIGLYMGAREICEVSGISGAWAPLIELGEWAPAAYAVVPLLNAFLYLWDWRPRRSRRFWLGGRR